ncbi:endoplasmic reticulum metallopeptidase 1 [Stomoxys calcitrans]|uniref:endoplasmic reticulum metallopeptidase 1 n=1 Tax=Stomoxys calcitrans TaxID=35570 RepID=UPI0027E34815|nr:endoplasmic reticulum metallopeptidase 1 [Stomoxys calcitrans]
MAFQSFDVNSDLKGPDDKSKKINWYWAPAFCAFWFLLFYVTVIPSFFSYPETLRISDEKAHPDEFIGERAQLQLLGLSSIGVKLTGSVENEVYAVRFLLNEIEKIKSASRQDLYDIEVDVQHSSGDFWIWGLATSYHNVTNIIVKLSPKKLTSESYLLVNSHFDSEVGSPAAADAGVMIVVILEVLRVISISENELKNPIVFLLNGAEESNFLAAHGFITQHKWATNCKALINLDSTGSGGKEVLFQTGPNHPWLVKHYIKSAKHPFATTLAEELFQNNFVPSDTDFRIFRDYGGVPGLDMAHALNGYIYHTKYDTFHNLERGTYQTTGDNVLALVWALANADELTNPEDHAEGHVVFYDFLGWFMVAYTETIGIIVNVCVSCCAIIFIFLSVFLMSALGDKDQAKPVYMQFFTIIGVQLLTVAVAVGLTILIAIIVEALNITQSWYTQTWIIFGLYFCPMFFVLAIVPGFYIKWRKNENTMRLNDIIACFMHAHCLILAIICIIMTGLGIRSAFFVMIAVFFYTISLILNMVVFRFTKKDCYFVIHFLCEVMPFWFYTYMAYVFLTFFIPMQGRDGPTSRPELLLSMFTVLCTLHFGGFILPTLNKFRKSKTISSMFAVICVAFIIIAATPAGFPFTKDVTPQRFYVLHTERIFHDYAGSVVKNDTGFYVQPEDTRPTSLDDSTLKNALPQSWIDEECATEMLCGLPLFSMRWRKWKDSMKWVTAGGPNLVKPTDLKLISKTYTNETHLIYSFSLRAADRVIINIEPHDKNKVVDWSFNRGMLDEPGYEPPYSAYHLQSMDDSPFQFWIQIERETPTLEGPHFRIGIGAHFLYHTHTYTQEYKDFLASFPEWAYPTHWTASYECWHF